MKPDNQHLDFLISQYVDGCLKTAGRKSVEQQLLTDPAARELYAQQREVQDLLDDWGNRIPLINWDEFDQKLAARLENEEVGGARNTVFRKWMRPVAAAAALFIAASLGYGWHAYSSGQQAAFGPKPSVSGPQQTASRVTIEGMDAAVHPSRQGMTVNEPGMGIQSIAGDATARSAPTIGVPENGVAAESLLDSIRFGKGLKGTESGAVAIDVQSPQKENKDESPRP